MGSNNLDESKDNQPPEDAKLKPGLAAKYELDKLIENRPENTNLLAAQAAIQVLTVLECVDLGQDPREVNGIVEGLLKTGLAESMTVEQYRALRNKTCKLDVLCKKVDRLNEDIEMLGTEIRDLNQQLDSSWFAFSTFAWLGSGSLQKLRSDRTEKRKVKYRKREERTSNELEIHELKNLKDRLDNFVKIDGKYIELSPLGKNRLNQLKLKEGRLKGYSFKQITEEADLIDLLVSRGGDRLRSIYDVVSEKSACEKEVFYALSMRLTVRG